MTGLGEFRGQSLQDLGDPDIASRYLAKLLLRGELSLLLGAGVSMASELPSWRDLVRSCEQAVRIDVPPEADDQRTSSDLEQAMEVVYEHTSGDDAFREIVRDGLYPEDMLTQGKYPDDILTSKLLIAIGALVMPSQRGSINQVITLNFDDLLEWYLHLHGFRTQSVSDFPTYLRSDVDVTVFHPHGFLPLSSHYTGTDWMVFRHSEFVARLAETQGRAFGRYMTNLLTTRRVLAVGTSMGDIDIEVQLATARQDHTPETLPAGFVVGSELSASKQRQLVQAGLVPVVLGSRQDIPMFILSICRLAADLDNSSRGVS